MSLLQQSNKVIWFIYLDSNPLLISKRGPDMMGLGDGRLVWFQDHFGAVSVDVKGAKD